MGRPVDNGPPGRDDFMVHLAIALKDNEELDALKVRRNANRKRAKTIGIDLGDMDQAIKMSDWDPSEVARFFSRKLTYLGYMNVDVGTQFDLFNGATPVPKQAPDFFAAGLYAGIKGKDAQPPANLSQQEAQRWLEGWHEGQRFLIMGLEKRAEQAQPPKTDEKAEPKVVAAGEPSELVLKAADFTGDDPWDKCELVNYAGKEDLATFDRIVVVDDAESEEVVLKDREAGIGISDEDFEASPDELAKQSPRKAAQDARESDAE